MRIGVVGLGLLGGSLAKALVKHTTHTVVGVDHNPYTVREALQARAIHEQDGLERCDVVFVCINPRAAVEYMLHTNWQPGMVVTDICGVKRYVVDNVAQPLHERGIRYIGGHPMAGRELSGFSASNAELFRGASYILTKDAYTDADALSQLSTLLLQLGCGQITISTAEEHDRMIAYTSQLAHVVSNAYIKNPDSLRKGFSAGSFLDLTRVAYMNADMWAELFMENADFLAEDIDTIMAHMQQVKDALKAGDEHALRDLLQQGSDIKWASMHKPDDSCV